MTNPTDPCWLVCQLFMAVVTVTVALVGLKLMAELPALGRKMKPVPLLACKAPPTP